MFERRKQTNWEGLVGFQFRKQKFPARNFLSTFNLCHQQEISYNGCGGERKFFSHFLPPFLLPSLPSWIFAPAQLDYETSWVDKLLSSHTIIIVLIKLTMPWWQIDAVNCQLIVFAQKGFSIKIKIIGVKNCGNWDAELLRESSEFVLMEVTTFVKRWQDCCLPWVSTAAWMASINSPWQTRLFFGLLLMMLRLLNVQQRIPKE